MQFTDWGVQARTEYGHQLNAIFFCKIEILTTGTKHFLSIQYKENQG